MLGLNTSMADIDRKFEKDKINFQKNEHNKIIFNFISKLSVKFSNLRFGVVRNC